MGIRTAVAALCCGALIFSGARAGAQEIDDIEKRDGHAVDVAAARPPRPAWESSVETTFLPGSRIRGTDSDLTMEEVKAGFSRRFGVTPRLGLSAGAHYAFRGIDAPQAARLPETLQTVSLTVGGEYRPTDSLTLGLKVTPGLSSDFRSFDSGDLRVPVAFSATYQFSAALSLIGGVAYTGQNHAFPVLPLLGAVYLPTEQWAFALGFPRTGVMYKPAATTEIFAGGEFSGGEYQLHDPSLGADVVSYRDYRALAGADVRLSPSMKLGVAGGYAFARRFVFYEGNRADITLDGTALGRVELKLFW